MPNPLDPALALSKMTRVAAFFFMTLPWLNPFSPGPVPQAMPLLFAWACSGGVLLIFALNTQGGQSPWMTRVVVCAWAAAAVLSAVIGLLQYLGASAAFGVWVNHPQLGEAYGNLRQRNQFATLLGIGLWAVIWLTTQAQSHADNRLAAQVPDQVRIGARMKATTHKSWFAPFGSLPALMFLAALLGAGNAASSSRTGLLQLLLTTGVALWWLRGRARHDRYAIHLVLVAALLTYGLATLLLPAWIGLDPFATGAWARLRTGDAVCASRLTLWRNVLHLIVQKPWLGWGWGELDYAHFITLYPGTRFCDILDNAHNLPLHLAVELGVPVALLLCGSAAWLIWRAQPWHERNPTRQLAWGVLAVIGLHSLLEYPLWYGPFQMAAGLSVWLLWRHPETQTTSQTFIHYKPLAPYLYVFLAILLIAYCGLAAWQYRIASQIYLPSAQRANAYRDHTLEKIKAVWLYQDTVRFAELTTTDPNTDNALHLYRLAKAMLHFSPEARVVEQLLDSARLLGRDDEVAYYAARFEAAFPKDYALWRAAQK